jgi:hypothetical protein
MGNDISEYEKRGETSLALVIFLKVTKIPEVLGMKRTIEMNRKNKNKKMKMKTSIEANTKWNEKTNVKMNVNMNMNGEIADAESFMMFQCSQWNQVTIAQLR